ncbi:MAG: DUF3987 domain-containing protein [Deltaproteobacteria bacterium]|jgi:hypothetical protein|nr:DUF3987 domain-containing protein [Deltaproteobacteria bacterium]
MAKTNAILQEALALAHNGRLVFPTRPDKTPLIKGWPDLATTDEKTITGWFDKGQPPNLAVITGHKSGFFCLDIDGHMGEASLSELERLNGEIAPHCSVRTASGGRHFHFLMPDFDLRNSSGKFGPGLDIRANGGYVLVPPSQALNRNGNLGAYSYLSEVHLSSGQLVAAPAWLLDLLRPLPPTPSHNPSPGVTAPNSYGEKALDEECRRISSAGAGERNDTLNRAAFAIFQLVGGGAIEHGLAEERLRSAALTSGLTPKEIEATLRSAAKRGLTKPRSAPQNLPVPVARPNQKVQAETEPAADVHLPPPPLGVFPREVQELLREASAAYKQLPLEVAIVAFLALLTASLGRSRVVRVKPGWEEAGNIYNVVVADSGVGKSHCFREMLKPVWQLDFENREKWLTEFADYRNVMEMRQKDKEMAADEPAPPKPIRRQYIIEDATCEAIGGILAENPRGLLWYSDELSSIILNLDRYSNSKGGTKSRLLSTYDGAPWKTSRRDSEKDQSAASATLSIAGTAQPKILRDLFTEQDALSGFLPRFIFIRAVRSQPALLSQRPFTGQPLIKRIANHLLSWEMNRDGELWQPAVVPLSSLAYSLYEDWHNHVMRQVWLESDSDNAIAAKLVAQVIRLALLLHSLDAALAGTDGLEEISLDTMNKALVLGEWIQAHQRLVWLEMGLDTEKKSSPLEAAVVQTVLSLEEYLLNNDWRMANDDFNRMVTDNFGQAVGGAQIGKAAAKLGIKSVFMGKRRGKEISPELMAALKAKTTR